MRRQEEKLALRVGVAGLQSEDRPELQIEGPIDYQVQYDERAEIEVDQPQRGRVGLQERGGGLPRGVK